MMTAYVDDTITIIPACPSLNVTDSTHVAPINRTFGQVVPYQNSNSSWFKNKKRSKTRSYTTQCVRFEDSTSIGSQIMAAVCCGRFFYKTTQEDDNMKMIVTAANIDGQRDSNDESPTHYYISKYERKDCTDIPTNENNPLVKQAKVYKIPNNVETPVITDCRKYLDITTGENYRETDIL